MENEGEINKEEVSIFELLKRIKNGVFDPRLLTVEQRQECVEVLRLEGQTHAAIAELLKWNMKTIKRDWIAIQNKNATKPSPELALRMIAEMIEKSSSKHDYLTRLARSQSGSLQEKSQAEYYAWKVLQETVQLLQSMGYLPNLSAKFVGEIYHHHDGQQDIDLEEMKKEIQRIETIITDEGRDDPALKEKLDEIRNEFNKVELNQKIKDLSDKISGESAKQEERENG